MSETEDKIQQLRHYFTCRDDVVMAFLFGSRSKGAGYLHAHSDWDIGVYFQPLANRIEWEDAKRDYPAEHEVRGD